MARKEAAAPPALAPAPAPRMMRTSDMFVCPLCWLPETQRRWVHRYLRVLLVTKRTVHALVLVGGCCIIAFLAFVNLYYVHRRLFTEWYESVALLALPLYLLVGLVYMWAAVYGTDPGFAPPDEPRLVVTAAPTPPDAGRAERRRAVPGAAPDHPGADERDERDASDSDDDDDDDARHCDICNVDRYNVHHHCRICNRCVTALDHHCVWIGTCVGRANNGRFLVLLFYAVMSALYSALTAAALLGLEWRARGYGVTLYLFVFEGSLEHGCLITALFLSGMALLSFGFLFLWFTYLAMLGLTTITLSLYVRKVGVREFLRRCVPWDWRVMLGTHLAPVGLQPGALLWWNW